MARKLTLVAPASDPGGTPDIFGPAGTRLWKAITGEWLIEDAASLEVLQQCCHSADMVARLRQLIDQDGACVRTKGGLIREHPAVRHELAYRQFIVRALGKLGVLTEPLLDGPGRPPKFGGV